MQDAAEGGARPVFPPLDAGTEARRHPPGIGIECEGAAADGAQRQLPARPPACRRRPASEPLNSMARRRPGAAHDAAEGPVAATGQASRTGLPLASAQVLMMDRGDSFEAEHAARTSFVPPVRRAGKLPSAERQNRRNPARARVGRELRLEIRTPWKSTHRENDHVEAVQESVREAGRGRRRRHCGDPAGFARSPWRRPRPRVVIVGGGAGGATVAHFLKSGAPKLDVTLIETNPIYSSSFFSNLYLGGFRDIEVAQPRLWGLRRLGIKVVQGTATDVDSSRKKVRTRGGRTLHLRQAGAVAWHRHQVRLDSGLFARGGARHAARLQHGAGRQAPPEAAAGGHARRWDVVDDGAQQSVSLSAGALRARVHDRALPQDPEAEVEAGHPRPQAVVLQAAGVHRGVRASTTRTSSS